MMVNRVTMSLTAPMLRRVVFCGVTSCKQNQQQQQQQILRYTTTGFLYHSEKTTSDIEGFQGEHAFASDRAKEIQNDIAEREESSTDGAGVDETATMTPEESSEAEAYNLQTQGISLHSCMQSQVPEPYQPDSTAPTHLNMPGGGTNQSQKYVAENQTSNHPYRKYSTSAWNRKSVTSVEQAAATETEEFRVWLKTCENLGLSKCDEAIANLREGRTTLKELFDAQEKELKVVAGYYQQALSDTSVQGLQGGQMGDNLVSLRRHGKVTLSPQGIQGDSPELFKIWLQNCNRFGFSSCDQLLDDYQSGKKTLAQLFEHQDDEIRQAAEEFKMKRKTEEVKKEESEEVTTLSQRQKLQRAIKDYGSTVVVFHVGISLMSLGGFYGLVYSGVDVVGILAQLGVGQSFLESKLAAGASTFLVAYAVHKVFAPVRIAITLTSTPFIVRYLRRIGFLKTPTKKLN
ncbi:uncharacterized protein LOC141902528 [Tubulanus polymorphus]|uniref:uncharacterized protein LOC141902528 n=1 Tax=Tubulanus polymorphus TaxID=672921 RepID=UPI003DA432E9